MLKLLYVSTKKITKSDIDCLEQLKEIFAPYEQLEYTTIHEPNLLPILQIEDDNDINVVSIYTTLYGKHDGFNWVHLEMDSKLWNGLGLRRTLWGEHKTISNVAVTYGRWKDYKGDKRAKLVAHEYPQLREDTFGMIHEYVHSKEGDMALVHYFLYGYDKLYTKEDERELKPKRYQQTSSLNGLLDAVYGSVSNEKPKDDIPAVEEKKSFYKPKNFSIGELVPKAVLARLGEDICWQMFDERLLKNLQWLRDRFGVTYVNIDGTFDYRGFDDGSLRTWGTSQHNHGRAVDCHFKDYTIAQVHDIIKKEYKDMPEPNVWIEATSNGKPITWLHMDVRYSDKVGIYFFNA